MAARKSHTTILRHKNNKQSKATSYIFPIEMIAKLEWTHSNAQQNTEQLHLTKSQQKQNHRLRTDNSLSHRVG